MRVVYFIPLFLGFLGGAQQVFACTGILAAGCEYCQADPSRCGIPVQPTIIQQADPKAITDTGKNAGKEDCLRNLTNCTAIGFDSGDIQLKAANNEGRKTCLNNFDNCTATGALKSAEDVKKDILSNAPVSDTTALVEAAKDTGKSECLRNLKGCTTMVVGVQSGNEQLESAKASCLNDLEHCTATGALKSGAEVKQTILSGVTPLDTTALKNTGKLDCLNDLEKCEATTETKTTKKGSELIPRYDTTLKQLKLPLVKNGDTPAINNVTMQLCPPFVENTTWTFQLIIPKFNGVNLSDKDCSQLNSGATGSPTTPAPSTKPVPQ